MTKRENRYVGVAKHTATRLVFGKSRESNLLPEWDYREMVPGKFSNISMGSTR